MNALDDSTHEADETDEADNVNERLPGTPVTAQTGATDFQHEPDAVMRTNLDASVVQQTQTFIMTSNVVFLTGSLLYLWIALWEWLGNDDDSSPDSVIKVDDDSSDNKFDWDSMDMLGAAAPFMYLVVAVVDLRYAFRILRDKDEPSRFGDDPRWEIGVGLLFGLAASCDFIAAVVLRDERTLANYLPSSIAAHLYVMMAIFALWGRDIPDQTTTMRLYQAADSLFLLGSLIDVSLSYFQTPNTNPEMDMVLERWSVASASLWVVNSLLYMLADTYFRSPEYGGDAPSSTRNIEPNVDLLLGHTRTLNPHFGEDSSNSSRFDEARSRLDSQEEYLDFEEASEFVSDDNV